MFAHGYQRSFRLFYLCNQVSHDSRFQYSMNLISLIPHWIKYFYRFHLDFGLENRLDFSILEIFKKARKINLPASYRNSILYFLQFRWYKQIYHRNLKSTFL